MESGADLIVTEEATPLKSTIAAEVTEDDMNIKTAIPTSKEADEEK